MELINQRFFTVFWIGRSNLSIDQERKLDEEDILYFDDNNIEQCFECLRLTSNEKILLVITGSATNKILDDEKVFMEIHNLHQIYRIYVDKSYDDRRPSQTFPKMKYIPSQLLYSCTQSHLHAYIRATEPFIFNTLDERSLLKMNGDFIHFQMLIDCFILDDFSSEFLDNYSTFDKSKNEFIQTCKNLSENNVATVSKIEVFERTYTSDQALYWYTECSFLYTLLNRAFRTNDTRLILVLRFFIIDLYNQLREKASEPLTIENKRGLLSVAYVYRGQIMSKHELELIRKSLGAVISVKSFLSTSLDQQVAMLFLDDRENVSESSLIPVLIEIDLGYHPSSRPEKPFANIANQSHFGIEQEVLFMVGSYFRVKEVRRGEKNIWHVRLKTLGLFDNPLKSQWDALYDHIRKDFIDPVLLSSHMGAILFQSGKFDEAQTYYEQLVQHVNKLNYVPEETNDQSENEHPLQTENKSTGIFRFLKDLATNKDEQESFEIEKTETISLCYYALGRITFEKELFEHSVEYYEAVLDRIPPSFVSHEQPKHSRYHVLRALCRLGLAATYELNGKLKCAFQSYTKALSMFEQSHDGLIDQTFVGSNFTYVQKALCLIGLGNLAFIEQEYQRANRYYRDALLLFDKYLPTGHPNQSRTRQKIANIIHIYHSKPDAALEDYNDCLENYLCILPYDHVDIARVYADMARAYEQKSNQLEKALEYAKKARTIFEKSLSKEHTDNLTIYSLIKRIERELHTLE